MGIINGKDLSFGQSSAGLPDVSDSIRNTFQPVVVGIVFSTQVNGYTQSVVSKFIKTKGARIQTANKLVISKTGERIWDSIDIYFLRDILLVADDLFVFNSLQYRVIVVEEWPEYGFNRYSVTQDYSKIVNLNPSIL